MEVLQLRTTNPSGTAVAATHDHTAPHSDTAHLSSALAGASLSDTHPAASGAGVGKSGAGEPEPELPPYVPQVVGAVVLPVEDDSGGEGDDILAHIGKPPSFSVSPFYGFVVFSPRFVLFCSISSSLFKQQRLFFVLCLCISHQKRKEKNREKKLKKNRIRAQIAARAATNPLDLGAEEQEEDSGSDSDDDTSAAVEDKSGPSDVPKEKEHKASKVVSESKPGTGDKQGKRGKRIEKEAKEERAQRAQALQARIDSEAQQVLLEQQKRQQAAQSGAGDGAAGSAPAKEASAASGTVQRCTTCGGAFTDPVLYRQHFRCARLYSIIVCGSLLPSFCC